ncbi:hypothetical protein Trydic_g15764, partial [Trypoxylus dichotomus]
TTIDDESPSTDNAIAFHTPNPSQIVRKDCIHLASKPSERQITIDMAFLCPSMVFPPFRLNIRHSNYSGGRQLRSRTSSHWKTRLRTLLLQSTRI